uniref:Uncharacterized protein n=1 Tax=Oryza glaberrima TaxID=4538 RepID=I1PCB6_ORYGL
MDATETLFADAFATVPAPDDRDPKATPRSGHKARRLSVRRGAAAPWGDRCSHGWTSSPACTLSRHRNLGHSRAGAPGYSSRRWPTNIRPRRSSSPTATPLLGVEVKDKKWQEGIATMAEANAHLFTVEVRLQFAICEVQNAVRVHRLYRHPRLLRLSRGVRMREAWPPSSSRS